MIIADIPRGADFIRDEVGFQLLSRDHRGYSGIARGMENDKVRGSGQMSIQRFRQVVSKARLVTAEYGVVSPLVRAGCAAMLGFGHSSSAR